MRNARDLGLDQRTGRIHYVHRCALDARPMADNLALTAARKFA